MLKRIATGILVTASLIGNQPAVAFSAKDTAVTIVGIGAAGALVGMSTLSFRTRPQNHFQKIWMGAALGVVVGVGVTAVIAATRTDELLDPADDQLEDEGFEEDMSWNYQHRQARNLQQAQSQGWDVSLPVIAFRF